MAKCMNERPFRSEAPQITGIVSLTQKLQVHLNAADSDEVVQHAMSYGSPSIESVLRDLKERCCTEVLALPSIRKARTPLSQSSSARRTLR
ncbi:ferrochelatase [Adlercreutzia murintestinalis]|uniref:ferrochelatase n=1 Tax=Adlercreutzia murintestinalis TaxID=2941325 RepID=UPI003D80E3F2